MKLSVIVVNHNSGACLQQCISTLTRACRAFNYELIVVDNASDDSPVQMLRDDFPHVRVINNPKDEGIAKAANQGINTSRGEYVLLVSPDIITGKKTIEKLIAFMDRHPAAGGAGVRMVTPQGEFISSSKHSLNKAWSTLIRVSGMARYFPKSPIYPQKKDWTNEYETAEVDVLNKAFMLLRRSAINKAGLFDERFTYFGYNIDMSFRLKVQGYKNYYFPKTYILNLRQAPTPKFSLKYFRHFYGAMFIFAAKYLFESPKLTLKDGTARVYAPQYEMD